MHMTSKRTLLLLLAILAGMVALPANAEPSIGGLDAEAAARVLRAQGVRVLAIGLELAPDAPRVAVAQPATYPPAQKAEPRAEHHGCNPWRRDLIVIPPPGVTVTIREVISRTTRTKGRDARRH